MLPRALPLIAALVFGAPVFAQSVIALVSDGDWTLYGVDNYAFTMWEDAMEFEGICVAETVQDGNRLQYAMFFREWRAVEPALIGLVMGQAFLPGRELEPGDRDLVIRSGTSTYRITGVDHAPDRVSFLVEAQHTPASALHLLAMMGDGALTLEEENGDLIAGFSAQGLEKVLTSLMDCGGVLDQ